MCPPNGVGALVWVNSSECCTSPDRKAKGSEARLTRERKPVCQFPEVRLTFWISEKLSESRILGIDTPLLLIGGLTRLLPS